MKKINSNKKMRKKKKKTPKLKNWIRLQNTRSRYVCVYRQSYNFMEIFKFVYLFSHAQKKKNKGQKEEREKHRIEDAKKCRAQIREPIFISFTEEMVIHEQSLKCHVKSFNKFMGREENHDQ